MDVKITSSNYEVINSGLATSFDGGPIEIDLLDNGQKKFHITFQFQKDETSKEHRLSAISQESGVILILTNFTNPLGTGTVKPINFATDTEGKELFINFYVYVVGDSNPTLHYTIYRES